MGRGEEGGIERLRKRENCCCVSLQAKHGKDQGQAVTVRCWSGCDLRSPGMAMPWKVSGSLSDRY